jgi:glycosyltransferase involved in cell wall biosynthesis
LNEAEGVQWVMEKAPGLRKMAEEMFAVDGGSTDGTREILGMHKIRIVDQEMKGRGEAFRVGVRESSGDHLVFFSPDGNEDPDDIPKLFDGLASGADMVIASRFLPESRNEEDDDLLPLRKWTNRTFTIAANILWNRRAFITDTINGFRGVTRRAFLELAPGSRGYTIEYEMTICGMKKGIRIEEIPTEEGNRVGGETKAPSFRTGLRFIALFLREMRKSIF